MSAPAPPPAPSLSKPSPSSCNAPATARCSARSRAGALAQISRTSLRPEFPRIRPAPQRLPRIIPLNHRPRRQNDAGMPADAAPMISAGVVLSQPPTSTAASIGWLAQKLLHFHRQQIPIQHSCRLHKRFRHRERRYLDWETARLPNPAFDLLHARCGKCVWHGIRSLKVVMMPMRGLPTKSSGEYPICANRDRCPNDRRSSGPSHR